MNNENDTAQDTFYVQSVDRALKLVDTISKDENRGLTLMELSSKVGMPTSTVYRLLQNLLNWNYVLLGEGGKYFLGMAFLKLGHQVGEGVDLINISRPFLNSLNDKSGETLYLSVFDKTQNSSVNIDKRSANGNIRLIATVGTHNDIYCSANGKALLFQASEEEIREILSKIQILPKTKHTITDVDTLINEIQSSKKKGYAVDIEECEYNVACIAAPIIGSDGKIAAAVSISGLVSNIIPPQRFDELKEMLISTTKSISKELGFNGE